MNRNYSTTTSSTHDRRNKAGTAPCIIDLSVRRTLSQKLNPNVRACVPLHKTAHRLSNKQIKKHQAIHRIVRKIIASSPGVLSRN
jgi:hypothetical protein